MQRTPYFLYLYPFVTLSRQQPDRLPRTRQQMDESNFTITLYLALIIVNEKIFS